MSKSTRTLALLALVAACAAPAQAQPPIPAPLPAPSAPNPYNASDDIFYHIMPIAWRHGQDPAPADSPQQKYAFGNFQGIIDGLPYLKTLGITGIWLNPIFPSPAYHGYQHDRADRINPWFGTEQNFLALVAAARAQGIKIYLDLVVYGISTDSEYFRDADHNRASLFGPYLAFTKPDNSAFIGYSFRTWNGDRVGFANWDLRSPGARNLVIGWSKKWLDPNGDDDLTDGIAGYRLDHVWRQYNKGEDGLGYHIDRFWREWRSELETVNPDVFTFAEQADWNSFGADLLVTSDGGRAHDAAFTKPFEEAARTALKTQTAALLYESMAATINACPPGRTFMAILGDHDVERLASAIGADSPQTIGRCNAAAAVLMLQPFPPIIYYGDELGMLGKKGNYNSDASDIPLREPMKWTALADGEGMTNYYAINAPAYKNRYSKDNDGRSVQEETGVKGSVLETYRTLAALRTSLAALRRGTYEAIKTDDPGVWAFYRKTPDQSLAVAINLSDKPTPFALACNGAAFADAQTGEPVPSQNDRVRVELPAHGFALLTMTPAKPK